jgi:hypothetical protein
VVSPTVGDFQVATAATRSGLCAIDEEFERLAGERQRRHPPDPLANNPNRLTAGNWHLVNLTAATGAPAVRPGWVPLSAYVFEAEGTQHVVYTTQQWWNPTPHVHELWWDTTHGYHHRNLTAASGAPPAYNLAQVRGYVFDGTQHVVYTATVGGHTHVHELWSDANGWHYGDLTAVTGAPDTTQYAPLSAYVGFLFAEVATNAWYKPDQSVEVVDVVFCPWTASQADVKIKAIPMEQAATADVMAAEDFGVGSEVFFVGLFVNHWSATSQRYRQSRSPPESAGLRPTSSNRDQSAV